MHQLEALAEPAEDDGVIAHRFRRVIPTTDQFTCPLAAWKDTSVQASERGMKMVLVVLIGAIAGLTPATVRAADGDLDPTFADAGIVLERIGQFADVARQADGKILVAGGHGTAFVVRLHPSGRIDRTFAPKLGALRARAATAVAVQDDGKILVGAASREEEAVVVRLLPSGAFDGSFGVGGMIRLRPNGGSGYGGDIVVLPDDRILVLAGSYTLRLLPDGSLDPTFSADGVADNRVFGIRGHLLVQPDDRVVGSSFFTNKTSRLLADGTLDPSFGTAGVSDIRVAAKALLPDGKLS
jgi:uncharacterized delta-60 repeat protein